MTEMTSLYRATDRLLDGQLRTLVEGYRAAGKGWREVATCLRTEKGVDVSHETLRTWAALNAWDVDRQES